jgi:hypothetical protein
MKFRVEGLGFGTPVSCVIPCVGGRQDGESDGLGPDFALTVGGVGGYT